MEKKRFELVSSYKPAGDQPQAIEKIANGILSGYRDQVILGVTGSGKTFTMANVIEKVQKPTLVIAHNKTLAAQLCSEFREFFPNNAVEYFVSYYDYYQPEAYIASSDTYIAKDSSINDEISRLRNSTTCSLNEREDVIVVASVSCIYGLGAPEDYYKMSISLRPGMAVEREHVLERLVEIQYERNDINFVRGTFRVRGDVVEIFPANELNHAIRVEFFGDEIDRLTEVDVLTGEVVALRDHAAIFPATHYVTSRENMDRAIQMIEGDLADQTRFFESQGKLLEAQRIQQRTNFDIEMLREIGYCTGIENYSRYMDGRYPGEPPFTLLDYFPKDFLMFIDESHVTVPQIRAMYNGDRARKEALVEYGFRLPAALDNRPLKFEEFQGRTHQVVYVSATPAPYELERSEQTVEQIIRPTGLLDPVIEVRPIRGQVDDLVGEIRKVTSQGYRVLVTTLTKKFAESLTDYLRELEIKVRYLHSDIDTLERTEIIRDLRLGVFDVLVGINLLREGLDLPEVALIAILDADKEGFLRSETSMIQTVGRAARNVDGRVIMYADTITDSMRRTLDVTNRRRALQAAFNEEHGITPESVKKAVRDSLEITHDLEEEMVGIEAEKAAQKPKDAGKMIRRLETQMKKAAQQLDFELAASLRDRIIQLRREQNKE